MVHEAGMILIPITTQCGCGALGIVKWCAGTTVVYACTIACLHHLMRTSG